MRLRPGLGEIPDNPPGAFRGSFVAAPPARKIVRVFRERRG